MANTKISALTAATTPLAGTEVLPIVQSSTTKQVSVADLTAGRSVSAASLSLTTTPLAATSGGTGQTSYAVGDLLYANTTTTLAKLADVATGNALISGGVGVAPSWGKIGLTTHVSGTLPTANGGTNLTSFTANGVMYASSTSALATGTALTFDGSQLSVLRASTSTALFDEAEIRAINTGTATINQRVDIAMRWQDGTYNGTGGISMVRESATARSGTLTFYPIDSSGNALAAMRLDSTGRALINTTTVGAGGGGSTILSAVSLSGQDAVFIKGQGSSAGNLPLGCWNDAGTGDNALLYFYTNNTISFKGGIDFNRGAGLVRYNTSSDGTLKNIIGDSDGKRSIEILKTTRLRDYTWKDDPDQKLQMGPIAQELYETYKGAVSVGGNVEKIDDEGNVTVQYRPWAVDKTAYSFHLVAGWQAHEKIIQDQQALIEKLIARVEALEAK